MHQDVYQMFTNHTTAKTTSVLLLEPPGCFECLVEAYNCLAVIFLVTSISTATLSCSDK